MGRSVSYLRNASEVTYFDTSLSEVTYYDEDLEEEFTRDPDEFDYQMNWDDFMGNIIYPLINKYKSLVRIKNEWDGNETSIILANNLIEIGVSEYYGIASVSIRPRNEDYVELAESWINKNWDNAVKVMEESTYHTRLNKAGTFSNGCSVYNKA